MRAYILLILLIMAGVFELSAQTKILDIDLASKSIQELNRSILATEYPISENDSNQYSSASKLDLEIVIKYRNGFFINKRDEIVIEPIAFEEQINGLYKVKSTESAIINALRRDSLKFSFDFIEDSQIYWIDLNEKDQLLKEEMLFESMLSEFRFVGLKNNLKVKSKVFINDNVNNDFMAIRISDLIYKELSTCNLVPQGGALEGNYILYGYEQQLLSKEKFITTINLVYLSYAKQGFNNKLILVN